MKVVDLYSEIWNNGNMKNKELRVNIPREILVDYQNLCNEIGLSVGKQTTQLIENFLQAQTDNLKIKKLMKGMK